MKKVLIVGTGLIGASVGLALKANGFEGEVAGWDANADELKKALECMAIDRALERREAVLETDADVVVLATPVLPILDWM
jgi:prephenate dehydrogenase